MKLGERLDEKARDHAWFEPPSSSEHKQTELDLSNDPEREFALSIDTAHIRCGRSEKARIFEIAVARCGRGRRGYVGRGQLTVISDGAEIMKRLPKALPKPTTHIIDWFHIAMKIRPLQQVAGYIVGTSGGRNGQSKSIDDDIRSVKWKLWHGQTDRAIDRLEKIMAALAAASGQEDASDARLFDLAQPLLTYVRSNRNAIANYGARYRSGRRIASSLAESAVDSLVARRMVKKQQMQWSLKGAHRMLQIRAAVLNGDLSERLAWRPRIRRIDIIWPGCSSRPRHC